MTPLEEEITKLSKIWRNFVSTDHHKDRDCHWYIRQYYSYGEKPYFQAEHYAYIGDDFEGSKCTTIEEAQEELRDRIALEIHKAKIWVARNLEELKGIPENSEELFFGSIEEYQRMLDYLNGAEWRPREDI